MRNRLLLTTLTALIGLAFAATARAQNADDIPELQAYADETTRLGEEHSGSDSVAERVPRVELEIIAAENRIDELQELYRTGRQRLETSGLNRATGLLLRRQYEMLPDTDAIRSRIALIERELELAEYVLVDRQSSLLMARDARTPASRLRQALEARGVDPAPHEARIEELVQERITLLEELSTQSSQYVNLLIRLDSVERSLLESTIAYKALIEERIFWVGSIDPGTGLSFGNLAESFGWFLSPQSWHGTGDSFVRDLGEHPFSTVLIVVTILASYVGARAANKRLDALAPLVARNSTDRASYTFAALGLTLLRSAPLPVFLWGVGTVLSRPPDQSLAGVAVGSGLRTTAFLIIPFVVTRHTVRPKGLAESHFRWHRNVIAPVRLHLGWLVYLLVITGTVVVAVERRGDAEATATLGRAVFTVAMGGMLVVLWTLLRPHGPVFGPLLRANAAGWADRLRFFWFSAIIGVPLTLIVITWSGYYYTARQLEIRLEVTFGMIVFLLLVNGVLHRWLFVARRKVAVETARRKRESESGEPAEGADSSTIMSEAPATRDDHEELDLPAISSQTRQFFRAAVLLLTVVGLYSIWSDVLPALRMLDRVEVLPTPQIQESRGFQPIEAFESATRTERPPRPESAGEATPAPPQDEPASSESGTPDLMGSLGKALAPGTGADAQETDDQERYALTVADLGLFVIILVAMAIGFRNFPALFEIALLQRLPIDSAGRYAISSVLRYSIVILGTWAALSALGLSWSRVQWLAAALTFGLAFGLQEIFANFMSGLIILAERPIRIGDTVTIGNVTGAVTKIRMRATTIIDWDRKELVIPNKTFITNDVINWSLSDSVLRLIIPVGISYEADVRKAETILTEIAKTNKTVLDEPAPYVVFNRFGDSTLDFELRVFIPSIEHFIAVRHDLNMHIIEAFREAGIEIAFPQRDLHVRSIGDLATVLERHPAPGEDHE